MGDLRRIALIAGSALIASYASVIAAPDGAGSGSGGGGGDIEMEPEPVGSGSAAPAAPEPPVKDPKAAKKWLSAAQVLVQKGDYFTRAGKPDDAKAQYENAITSYEKAIEAGDDIGVYYALALVEDKLGHAADAYRHLKLVVDPKAAQKPDVVKKAQTKLDDVAMKVGLVSLTIKPEGTQIQLGGKDVGESPMTAPLVLDPGTYTLSFIAVGYQPREAEIKVEAGSESERKIELEPVKIVVKPHTDEPEVTPEVPKPPSRLPLYVGAGATGGFFVIALITGIDAVKQHSTFVRASTSPLDRQDAQSNGRTLAHVTDICLVGALGAAGFTAYWYFMKYQPGTAAMEHPPAASDQPKATIAPWVQGNAGGLIVGGSF